MTELISPAPVNTSTHDLAPASLTLLTSIVNLGMTLMTCQINSGQELLAAVPKSVSVNNLGSQSKPVKTAKSMADIIMSTRNADQKLIRDVLPFNANALFQ